MEWNGSGFAGCIFCLKQEGMEFSRKICFLYIWDEITFSFNVFYFILKYPNNVMVSLFLSSI